MSATRQDLNNALDALTTKANTTLAAANDANAAAVAAANRVAALPPDQNDFQTEVDKINVISTIQDQIASAAAQTKATCDGILPVTPPPGP
jgi:hypothetical protein